MGANPNRWKVSKMPADGRDNSVLAKPCPNRAQTDQATGLFRELIGAKSRAG